VVVLLGEADGDVGVEDGPESGFGEWGVPECLLVAGNSLLVVLLLEVLAAFALVGLGQWEILLDELFSLRLFGFDFNGLIDDLLFLFLMGLRLVLIGLFDGLLLYFLLDLLYFLHLMMTAIYYNVKPAIKKHGFRALFHRLPLLLVIVIFWSI
jgi:hypothetical protein